MDQLREEVLSAHAIRADSVLNRYRYAFKGFAAKLSMEQVEALQNDPRIARVSPNVLLRPGARLEDAGAGGESELMAQTVPWGVTRVGGPFAAGSKEAWILDTGIDLDHPDLNVDVVNSASFIATESADDGNGHGTHVAGIIAAKDNSIGTVGVAADATVVAVKVCDSSGFCPINSIMNGVDYISTKAQIEDIVNISTWAQVTLQNEAALEDMEDAIRNAANTGICFTLIAGNAGDNATFYSPGRVTNSNVWTMSGIYSNDVFWEGSNWGNPPITYASPGVHINSLWKDGGTQHLTGTSMAAPHVAGLLLAAPWGLATGGFAQNDPDGNPDPIAEAADNPFCHPLCINLDVSINGSSSINFGGSETYTADVSGGSAPYSYLWNYTLLECRGPGYDCSEEGVQQHGSSSSTFEMSYNSNFNKVKIELWVTDDNSNSGSDSKTVTFNHNIQ